MAELLRLMKTMIVKIDDLGADMKVVKTDVQILKADVKRLDAKFDFLSARVEEVSGFVIDNTRKIRTLEDGGSIEH